MIKLYKRTKRKKLLEIHITKKDEDSAYQSMYLHLKKYTLNLYKNKLIRKSIEDVVQRKIDLNWYEDREEADKAWFLPPFDRNYFTLAAERKIPLDKQYYWYFKPFRKMFFICGKTLVVDNRMVYKPSKYFEIKIKDKLLEVYKAIKDLLNCPYITIEFSIDSDFKTVQKRIKTKKLLRIGSKIYLNIIDFFSGTHENMNFNQRRYALQEVFLNNNFQDVRLGDMNKVLNNYNIIDYINQCDNTLYDGIVLVDDDKYPRDDFYSFLKCHLLFANRLNKEKYKIVDVIDVKPFYQDGDYIPQGKFVVKVAFNFTQVVPINGSVEYNRYVLDNKEMFIGRYTYIRYLNKTKKGYLNYCIADPLPELKVYEKFNIQVDRS